jgi:hypothetical protein
MCIFVQQMLSKTKMPGFIEQIVLTSLNFGKFPPLLSSLRVLPPNSEGITSLGIDIEYVGGAYMVCETRVVNVRLETHPKIYGDPAGDDVAIIAAPLYDPNHEGKKL